MNNKVYMRAAAVMADPNFTALIEEAKQAVGQFPDMELEFPSDMGAEASLCIAMNPDAPDFMPLVRYIETVQHGRETSLPEMQHRLLGFMDAAWKVINAFFPVDIYGLPSTELWTWVIRCIAEEQHPEPEQCIYPVFSSFDPDQILLQAEVKCLRELLRHQGVNPYEAMKKSGFENTLDAMANILAVEPRVFIEVFPGETFSRAVKGVREKVEDLQSLLFEELDRYEVPLDYKEKLRDFFFPRQFQGATLTEIAESLPGEYDKSNVSRENRKVSQKAGYIRPLPHPRGRARLQ
jgi:hypothetical protein